MKHRKLRKIIAMAATFALVINMMSSAMRTEVEAHDNDFHTGRYTPTSPIRVSNLNFALINAQNSILTWDTYRGATISWGGLSSNVRIGAVTTMTTTQFTASIKNNESIVPIIGTHYNNSGGVIRLGRIVPRAQNGAEIANLDIDWHRVEIEINIDPTVWAHGGASVFEQSQRAHHTIRHEVGHVLKLAHPLCGLSPNAVAQHNVYGTTTIGTGWYPIAAMNQGFPNNVISANITAHDVLNLRRVWGN
jgi:hypothetical protein